MNAAIASAVRGAATGTAVAAALFGMLVTGAFIPANAAPGRTGMPALLDDPGAPTNPNDPRCAEMPLSAPCQGGTYDVSPTGPSDPACVRMPTDPVCAGGPYAAPVSGPPAGGTDPFGGMPADNPDDVMPHDIDHGLPPDIDRGIPHDIGRGMPHDIGGGMAGRR